MYKRRSVQEKQAELKAIQLDVEQQVDHYLMHPELILEFIQFGQQFHQYSLRNRLLMNKQMRQASFVASFNDWKQKGYQVNKGEKALKILRPVFRYEFQDENGEWLEQKYASIHQKRQMEQGQLTTRKQLIGTATTSVFDISQTNVPIEDYPRYVKRHFISETDRSFEDYIRGCHLFAQKHQLKVTQERLGALTGGYYQYGTQRIALNQHLENEKVFGTLVHELAHSQLHPDQDSELSHEAKEIQAQGVSAIVLQYYGQEPYDYSLDYLKSYGERLTKEERTQLLSDTLQTCFEITQTIDEYIEHKVHYQSIRQTYALSEEHFNDYLVKQLYDVGEDEQKRQALLKKHLQSQSLEDRTASLTYALNQSKTNFQTADKHTLEVNQNTTDSSYTIITDTNNVQSFNGQTELVDYLVQHSATVTQQAPVIETARLQHVRTQHHERSR